MTRSSLLRAGAVLAALAIVLVAYLPGVSGPLFYDDLGNLEGLSRIHDTQTALDFVTSGFAGPTGRPLALASFLPHAAAWPDNATSILSVNILLHALNFILLMILGWMILDLRSDSHENTIFWIALAGALMWAVLPILASTSLIAVQRMTSLGAFFGLIGLVGFVGGYYLQRSSPLAGVSFQFAALGLGTFAALFTKENGALIPVYALVIEVVLMRRFTSGGAPIVVRRAFLLLVLLAIAYYISPLHRDWFTVSELRGFSSWDRVQTQAVLLWEYLRLAFLPRPSAFGPFHDHRAIDFQGTISLIAILGWAAVIAIAAWLAIAKKGPWLLFAILWFFTGHILESSSLLLEIYFEHRNYLALYGLCLALAVAAFSVGGSLKRLGPALLFVFIALQTSVLVALTTVWGQPTLSAELWSINFPSSYRAANHHVAHILSEDIEPRDDHRHLIYRHQRTSDAIKILDHNARHCPKCLEPRVDALRYSCYFFDEADIQRRFDDTLVLAESGKGPRPVINALFRLRDRLNTDGCGPLSEDDILDLVVKIRGNPFFSSIHFQTRLLFLGAALADDLGQHGKRDEFLLAAEQLAPQALPVLQFQVYSALNAGDQKSAVEAVDRRREFADARAAITDRVLDGLLYEIRNDARFGGEYSGTPTVLQGLAPPR